MKRVVWIAALVTTLALASCGEPVLNSAELEAQIATELEAQTGVVPTSVDCPDGVAVEAGGTFDCTVTADDGSTANVSVTQTDDNGSISWEVDG